MLCGVLSHIKHNVFMSNFVIYKTVLAFICLHINTYIDIMESWAPLESLFVHHNTCMSKMTSANFILTLQLCNVTAVVHWGTKDSWLPVAVPWVPLLNNPIMVT